MNDPVYLDLTSDFAFKRIFGSEPNKDLLISFINQLFIGRKNIVDITYDKTEHVGDIGELGSVIMDLTCTGADGVKFIIEVQTSSQVNFKRRMLYYGSKIISDQAPKGNRKAWNYGISEVYVIVLMDGFTFTDDAESDRVLLDICLCNRATGAVFYDAFGFIYIQLCNFTKGEEELANDLDGWLFVLRNMSRLHKIPTYLRKPVFEKLFNLAAYSKLNKTEKTMYDISLKRKWDSQNVLDYARMEGEAKGRQEEREKAEHDKRAIALALKKMDMPLDDIAKITGFSLSEIKNLK